MVVPSFFFYLDLFTSSRPTRLICHAHKGSILSGHSESRLTDEPMIYVDGTNRDYICNCRQSFRQFILEISIKSCLLFVL